MDTEKNCLCWQKIIPAGKMGKENVLKYSGRDLKVSGNVNEKHFWFLHHNVQILIILKLRYGLVCKRLSQTAVLSCYRRIHQHDKTVFPPSLLPASTQECFPTFASHLCSSRGVFGENVQQFVSIRAHPGRGRARAGNSGSFCSAGWDLGEFLLFVPHPSEMLNLNKLFLYKLVFERSVKDKRALPGQRRGGKTWASTAQMWKIKQI